MLTTATRAPATEGRATVVAVMVAVEDSSAIFELGVEVRLDPPLPGGSSLSIEK